LQGKTPFVVLRTYADSSGNLHATGFDIVKAPVNNLVGVSGPADAAPTMGATTNTVKVHGVSVIYKQSLTMPIIAGSYILAAGALTTDGSVDTTTTGGTMIALPKNALDRCMNGF